PSADVDRVKHEVEEVIGLDVSETLPCSAKTGVGVKEIIEALVRRVPPPKAEVDGPLRALLFDSWYDSYRGAVCQIRVIDGTLRKGDRIKLMATGGEYEVTELTIFAPFSKAVDELGPGEVG